MNKITPNRAVSSSIILFIFVAGMAAIAFLFPFHLLSDLVLNGQYKGPNAIIFNNPNLVLFYNSIFILIMAFYFYLIQTRTMLKLKTIIMVFFILVFLGMITYPPVFDPLYYHLAAKTWVVDFINPYSGLMEFSRQHPHPIVEIPVWHNYIYGPIWLFISSFFFQLSQGSYFWFSVLVKLLCLIAFFMTLFLIKRIGSSYSWEQLLIFCGFNPIFIIFMLTSGHTEMIQVLLLVVGLYAASRQNIIFANISFFASALIKISTLSFALPILVWLIAKEYRKNGYQSALYAMFFKIILPNLLILAGIGLLLGFNGNYFEGVQTVAYAHRNTFVSIAGIITLFLTSILNPKHQTLVLNINHFLLNVLFICFLFYYTLRACYRKEIAFKQIIFTGWIILNLSTYLSGIIITPWYTIPSLFIATLLDEKEKYVAMISTIFMTIGVFYFNSILYFDELIRLAIIINAILLTNFIPTLLIISTMSPRVFNYLKAWHSAKLPPFIKPSLTVKNST